MGLKQWLIRKILLPKGVSATGNIITEEMREKALETRRLNHEVAQAEKRFELQKRIENIEKISNPKMSFEENLVNQVLPLLLSKIGTPQENAPNLAQGEQPNSVEKQSFTDEEIEKFIKVNPKLSQYGKQFSSEDLRKFLQNQMPNATEETFDKVIAQVQNS